MWREKRSRIFRSRSFNSFQSKHGRENGFFFVLFFYDENLYVEINYYYRNYADRKYAPCVGNSFIFNSLLIIFFAYHHGSRIVRIFSLDTVYTGHLKKKYQKTTTLLKSFNVAVAFHVPQRFMGPWYRRTRIRLTPHRYEHRCIVDKSELR